jgi:hypothetical protein
MGDRRTAARGFSQLEGRANTEEEEEEEEANADEKMTTTHDHYKLNRTREDKWNELAHQRDPAWRQ